MGRIVYVNGRYLPYHAACVHAEDRGFQFADAIYEVCEVRGGGVIDETRHLDRLERSLRELHIASPMSRSALSNVLHETVRRNRVTNGLVYLQVSRGAGPRNFLFPSETVERTVVCIARQASPQAGEARAQAGIAVKTVPDTRWARCDIKTVMLLPSALAKQAAQREGAQEAWFVDDQGFVTEGASSNAWIVERSGVLRTRACDAEILRGITRTTLLDVLKGNGLEVVEEPFRVEQVREAAEAFITSATTIVTPVVRIDGYTIGSGRPGDVALRLRRLFHGVAERVRL